jgi:hypothetical protein
MPLFGQRELLRRLQLAGVPGLADVAVRQGWQPVAGPPFGGQLDDEVGLITVAMFGSPRELPADGAPRGGQAALTEFTDAYRGTLDGRRIIVANGWTTIPAVHDFPAVEGVAVCAVELTSFADLVSVQPRGYPAVLALPQVPTGSAAFDARFGVQAAGTAGRLLTPEVRQAIMARDDWFVRAEGYLLGCVSRGPFHSVSEVSDRIAEVLAIAAAVPATVRAAELSGTIQVLVPSAGSGAEPVAWDPEASADTVTMPALTMAAVLPAPTGPATPPAALGVRLGRLASLDDALAMLASLTPGEREQLAGLDTPLAALADAQTPQEATARYRTLDPQRKLQLAAMFMRANAAARNHR